MKGTHHQGAHHIVPPLTYVKTLAALLALMGLTIYFGGIVFGPQHLFGLTIDGSYLNNGIAMLIAVTKAFLVITIFMGVKYASSLVKLWAMMGFIWLTLIFIILNDYGTRKYEPVPSWTKEDAGTGMNRTMESNKDMDGRMLRSRP